MSILVRMPASQFCLSTVPTRFMQRRLLQVRWRNRACNHMMRRTNPSNREHRMTLSRRSFLHMGAAALAVPTVARAVSARPAARPDSVPSEFELEELGVAELQDAMRAGRLTARSICAGYLARIAALDPQLHAVIEINPDAPAIAEGLDLCTAFPSSSKTTSRRATR